MPTTVSSSSLPSGREARRISRPSTNATRCSRASSGASSRRRSTAALTRRNSRCSTSPTTRLRTPARIAWDSVSGWSRSARRRLRAGLQAFRPECRGKAMAKRLGLWIVVIAVGLAAAIAGGISAQRHLQETALNDAFARLRLFHELRRAALEDYLKSITSDVRAASDNARVVDASEKLAFAWSTMGPEARKVLTRQYITENPYPASERYKLDAVDENSYYARDHRAFHDWATRFREHFGYYDVFLISPSGDILYTVAKEIDFATNLKTGPYRKSPLAEVFRRAVARPEETLTVSD